MYTFMLPGPVWIHRQTRMQMRPRRRNESERQSDSEVCISDSEAAWLEFCHATIYKLKWIRSSMPWPPLKTLHCWWAMIASAIDWRGIRLANPASLRRGHPKQFRHIERLIRATELPLWPTKGKKKKKEVWGCDATAACSSLCVLGGGGSQI